MGCWEIGALLLLVVFLFPKPFFRYASRWMKTVPRASPAPAAGDWVDACLDEEERLGREDVPVWLGGVVTAAAAAILAWMSTHRGDAPLERAALGLALGLALLAAGLGVERFSGWFARCFHAAGISLLLVTLGVSACRDGSIPPLLALAFLAVVAVTAAALLGRRPGAVALAIGMLAGAAVATPLDWKSLASSGGLLIPLILMLLLPWVWRRGWFVPLALAVSGFMVGTALAGHGGDGPPGGIVLGALVAGALLLARMEPYVQGVAWIGAGFAIPLILLAPPSPPGLALGLALAATVWLAHWGAVRPARWTALAALSGVTAFLLLAFRGGSDLDWSGPALAASFLYLGAAWLTARQGAGDEPSRLAVAPLAVATAAFAALAVALEIGRGWPGIAAALLVPFLIALAAKLRLPMLANLAIVTAILSLLCTLSSLDELGSLGTPRDTPWLLYGFGAPFLAMVAAIWLARRQGAPRSAARMEWVAAVAGMMLATIMVRQFVPAATTSWLVAASLAPLLAFAAYRHLQQRGGT